MPRFAYFYNLENLGNWFSYIHGELDHWISNAPKFASGLADVDLDPVIEKMSTKLIGPRYQLFHAGDTKALFKLSELIGVPIPESYLIKSLEDLSTFEKGIQFLKVRFKEISAQLAPYQDRIRSKIKQLDKVERFRLEESYHCLRELCYFSSVVNAVVALESRLLKLLKNKNEPFLRKKSKDLRFTLGQLVSHYTQKKAEFDNVIPEKYESLLTLCNSFRIISVHAKEERINVNEANAIFNLTLTFLLDERCSY